MNTLSSCISSVPATMLFKDMLKVLAARMILTGVFLFFIAIPFWKMVL